MDVVWGKLDNRMNHLKALNYKVDWHFYCNLPAVVRHQRFQNFSIGLNS